MDIKDLLDIAIPLVGVIGLGVLFFFYFTNEKVRNIADKGLQYIPFLLTFAKRFVTDKKGEFDTYDALELLTKVSERIKATVTDPENKTFADVEQEVFDIVREELEYYKNLPGVPDLSDPALRIQVEVVFQNIQRALSEDRTRDDS
jgi:hypothetical protein